MLNGDFFEGLVGAEGLEDVLSYLGESPMADEIRTQEDLDAVEPKVKALYAARIKELRDCSPDPDVVGLLELPGWLRSLKSFIKRTRMGMDVPPVESRWSDETWERLLAGLETDLPGVFVRAVERAGVAGGKLPESPAVLDAALDTEFLCAICEAAERTGSGFVSGYYRRYDTARGVEMLWRARALGMDEGVVSLYSHGRRDGELFAELARSGEEEWPRTVASRMEGIRLEVPADAAPAERTHLFAVASDRWLMDYARAAKYVPFGPERVFGCALGLEAEAYNSVLAVGGRASHVAPAVLRRHLRATYV